MEALKKETSLRFNHTLEAARPANNLNQEDTTNVRLSFSYSTLIELLVDEPGLVYKEEIVFEDGTVYKGQCKQGTKRHGFGIQVWPDGARYEGYWKDGVACGRGKFFHIDGDVYDGNWEGDKANGYGVYIHSNGSKYEGDWINDK